MGSQKPQQDQQPKRKRGRPRKYPIKPTSSLPDSAKPTDLSLPAGEFSIPTDPERNRRSGRVRRVVHPAPPNESSTESISPPLPSNSESSEGPAVRIVRSLPTLPRHTGGFSGLRDQNRVDYTLVQIRRIQGDPEEVVYLTDSEEEENESTDVEDGGFEGARQRREEDTDIRRFLDDYPRIRKGRLRYWERKLAEADQKPDI